MDFDDDWQCFHCGKLRHEGFSMIDSRTFMEDSKNNQLRFIWDCEYCSKTNHNLRTVPTDMIKEFQLSYMEAIKNQNPVKGNP